MIQGKAMVLILGAVTFSAAGQLFLKSGAQHLTGLDRLGFLMAAVRDVRILSGLAAWIASTLCWIYVLRVVPLSRAYGLTSLTYVVVPLASVYLFSERIRPLDGIGMVLIFTGIACLLSGD